MSCLRNIVLVTLFVPCGVALAQEAPPAAPPPANLTDIRQVQMQVLISETNETGLRDIGTNLFYNRFVKGQEKNGAIKSFTTELFDPIRDFEPITLPAPRANPPEPPFLNNTNNPAFDPPLRPDLSGTLNDGIQTRGGFGLTAQVLDADYGTVDAVFRGLERNNDSDLISKPELLVINGQKAIIKAGGEFPFQSVKYSTTGLPQLNVEWKQLGVNFTMTPTILSNSFVKLHIEQLEVSELARIDNIRGVDLPVFSKRSQQGVVMVPDGKTLVIGGLSSKVVRRNERRVPVVGSIPVLGFPFRSRESEAEITTLLIFVSPTVVDLRNMSAPARGAMSFWESSQEEWQHADKIKREIDAMQDGL
jgi:type II secretory pathway component GspD/PulD (secretin)